MLAQNAPGGCKGLAKAVRRSRTKAKRAGGICSNPPPPGPAAAPAPEPAPAAAGAPARKNHGFFTAPAMIVGICIGSVIFF